MLGYVSCYLRRRMMRARMTQPWGWERSAQHYLALYAELVGIGLGAAGAHRPAMPAELHVSEAVDEPALVGA